MPALLDHFRPPLSERRHWHSFHHSWATFLAADLNRRLPEPYFAEPNVQFGVEIDVAAFDAAGGDGATGWDAGWSPGAPAATVPLALVGDVVEVAVYDREGGPTLAGAVELVSPANKDRAEHRDAFVAKCRALVQRSVGVVVVDVVTSRRGDLHAELIASLGSPAADPAGGRVGGGGDLYAAAYRPTGANGAATLEVWREALAVGRALPTMPLWLLGGPCLPVDLAATYDRTCRELKIA